MSAVKLPVTYSKARTAIAQCARVDECQQWADKAAALRAYAIQMKDGKLEADAIRIRDRAIRRGGELLQQVKRGHPGKRFKDTPEPLNRNGAAKAAGLSPGQAKTMMRVANVPEEKFELLVEGTNPPSAKRLADMGKKPSKARVAPVAYRNEWIDWTSAVRTLAVLPACGLDVLATRNPAAVPQLIEDAIIAYRNLDTWLDQLRKDSK